MNITYRDYQPPAIEAGLSFFRSKRIEKPRILIAPTAAGKSIIIAGITHGLNERVLVIQPSSELLVQNFNKYLMYDDDVSAFSASVGQKRLAKVVFGTIGTLVSHPELFAEFKCVIVDEVHLFPPDFESQFGQFLSANPQMKLLGLTATPFRLEALRGGAKLVMLHNGGLFRDYCHIIQVQDICQKYWAKINYVVESKTANTLRVNSTGADYTEKSLTLYGKSVDKQIRSIIGKFMDQPLIIFVPSVAQAEDLAKKFPDSACVHGKTNKDIRKRIVMKFKSGEIKRLFNVNVFSVGFDAPGLIGIIDAVPTLSFARYYQRGGRLTRPHPLGMHIEKFYFDLAGNSIRFGPMEDFEIRKVGSTYHAFSGQKQLTGVKLFSDERSFEPVKPKSTEKPFLDLNMPFGKFKDKKISEMPAWYLKWGVLNLKPAPLVDNMKTFLSKSNEPVVVEEEF